MKADQFCYWFMGSLELTPPEDGLNEEQTQMLKNHLNMCFKHMVRDDGSLRTEKEWEKEIGSVQTSDFVNPVVNC